MSSSRADGRQVEVAQAIGPGDLGDGLGEVADRPVGVGPFAEERPDGLLQRREETIGVLLHERIHHGLLGVEAADLLLGRAEGGRAGADGVAERQHPVLVAGHARDAVDDLGRT